MKLTIKTQSGQKVVDLNSDLQFNTIKGEQYVFSNGFSNYVLNFKDNQESVTLTFNVDGKSIKVELNGIVPLLQANTANMPNPTVIIINKDLNEKDVDNIVENSNFDGGEIIDRLEALLSKPVELGDNANSNLTLITDYQTLLESLGAAAAGAEAGGNATGNGSTFNSIFSLTDGGLNNIADTARWENLSESIGNIPVDTGNNTGDRITIFTSITSSDVNENAESVTFNIFLSYVPQGTSNTATVNVTDQNGKVTTYIVDINAEGRGVLTIKTQDMDVYNDSQSLRAEIVAINGGDYEEVVFGAPVTVNITDVGAIDTTTLTLNDVSVNEGTGTATVGGSLDYAPQTTLVVTLSNGSTITFGPDYVAGTIVQSTPFAIQTDDVYKDGETYDITVASTTGGNFENLVTTDKATVTVTDTKDTTTLTLNDVSVNEGTGTATVGGSLDYAPQTTLVVTLSNGSTITFGPDYVAGTIVQSTPFAIQTDDVYKDGETYDITVASTTGGNFENLVTTDKATVTVTDTKDTTTLTLNDVSVNEGTGTATVGGSLDYAPQTTLVVTLSNGSTITFGPDYVAGTIVQSTPFAIQTDDVYKDGETYDITVASTTGGNFENLVTTDKATVTVTDTKDTTTLTLNDVSVNEGTGTATVGGSLDYAPQTTLVVTLSNGSTITFGPDYVAGTIVQSTPFAIQTDDVYKDGETYDITVASTTGGNFENLVTTDKATVTVTDTKDTTTLTLNDVSVNEGTGTATVGGSLDYAPQTTLVVTLSNGSTITFGPDYVAGTIVQSTPFAIQTDDVYKDGETYDITVASTTGGNFENLVTTDKATVTVTDTKDTTTLTLNDVSVNEGTGTATVGGSLDYAPQTTLVVTLSNGSTITFGPDYVAGTIVQSTPFAIQTDDVYKDGETYDITVASTTGGNFENLVTTDKATVTVTDTKDTTTLTLNDVSVNEGTGTATVGGSLDYAPQTTLVVTLSNGSTITFGPDYVAGTIVQSTPFAIQTDDVYKDGETYDITVASTTGGNFENLVTTDKATVTVTDTKDTTTLTLNDVSVNEGTGTATVGGSLDYAPQTTLVVTLSNGSTITFGPDYVAGTIVQSTPFAIQTDDVYKDGETYDITVASTTGGNFENLVTTDKATVTVTDTKDTTTLTLNDVSVNEGTGTATVGGSLDYAPQTTLVVTLSNGSTITFGPDYVAGTIVQSTPFAIQTDDVYKDGETYDITVASTTGGNFENLVTTDKATVTVTDTKDTTTLTLNDVSVNEGTGTATVGGSLDYAPQTTLVVTLSNGSTITFGPDYVAGTIVQSTPFAIQTDDVYKDGETYDITVASTTGGNFENLVTTDKATVTVTDTKDTTTLTLNDVSVNEGTGTATVGGSLDYAPQTTLVVTLSNGSTITFGPDYVAGTIVQSTPFAIQTDDVYKDGETYDITVASTTGGNFENLVTTDKATVTVTDTKDTTTLTLNDVSVNEGTGTATVGGSLDYAPQTTLVVTLSNGSTITFGPDYVAGTIVQSTPFAIQTDDVYKDGETYDITVASTTGGNFENLVTTDKATVTVTDTKDTTTLTLNDVSVNEGTGTATVGGSLDYAPQTTLVVTLSNGSTITFGPDYVAGTIVQSTPFAIQTDDVYKDGETYDITVASTTGGNFENLVTTDKATVTVTDTKDTTTLTLNDVSVNEGTGTATVGGSLDYAPQTTLVVTLSNGSTITFGPDYVAGTIVQSTPFAIQTDDVYKDGETYDITVASTTGGNFENLVTTDKATVTVTDTKDTTTLTLNDVSVNEGTGTATVGGSLDYAPQTTLVVTLSNGSTITFGPDYVAGTIVQSTPFAIQTDDVYKDGETYDITVASTTGGNFENLVTTDKATVTVTDTKDTTTLTLNDVSVNEGTGTATVGGSLDYAPQTTLVVTLSNGSTITFGPDYVAGTIVQSTPFAIQTDDVYKDGETYDITVASTTGGNFENLVTTDKATVTVTDTKDTTTLTLNDVSVNEGTGTATVGGSLDYAPQTTLVVTLSNGSTITFGPDYVAGTIVQSTPFAIQTDDVYKDGETYDITVASTTGGNFENLVTTDKATVTVTDTKDTTTLTLNDVSVNEGTGTATVGGSLDYAPQTTLVVTLSNGSTITFGPDYVAGTIVQSTPFAIQTDDVYKDGETYDITVASTTGGNFENLVTTDKATVTVTDTKDTTTLTLNDVSVNEGTGTATVGGSLDYAPQTTLVVTLSNGSTITFGPDYVAGTIVQSTPFAIQTDDVYKDGETYDITVASTTGGNFENLVTTDKATVTVTDTKDTTTLTLNDVSVNEGTGTATVGGSLDYAPQTTLVVTLSNGSTITFGPDYVAGTIVQSTPFAIQTDDVYKDGETYDITVASTTGGNFENLVTTDKATVTVTDTKDTTTLTLNDVSVNEGTGTATVGGSLDYAPQTTLVVTLSNGSTITFGPDYVAGTIVQSTPFAIQTDDVYKDGETYDITVASTTGGNFENLVTTDKATVTVTDTKDTTTLTLNDVSVNEGTGTATVGGSLDYAPQTTLVVTLSNGSTITFGPDYVAGTIVQSTPFAIQTDDVYKDGETYDITVASTTGGNFENLVTTDKATVTVTDTKDTTTLTLNDVSVNEGTGTATVGGSLDYAPQTTLVVTLSNGSTITFGPDYVAGTIVQSTPFAIQTDDVYKDGETYDITVASTTGGNFENLVTTDKATVTVTDTKDTTTLTLNDVSVNEGTGTATVGGSLDYAPQTTLVVTLSNGSTITFGPDYVAGTIVQSTPFAIQTDDVYKDGETYDITVASTTGGNFENLVTTDKATVTVTDTKDTTTLTLNDVSVNEGTGTATVGGSLDYAPQTTLVVTLSNGSTITFGPDYVAGTIVQSTPFAIQTDDVYKDGETYDITVASTTGGNFENLVTTDKATVTVTDTKDTTTLTLNDVSVNEGTGTATVGGSLDYAPQTTLVVTLSNGSTITFGPDYVAGTIVQSTPFAIQTDDVYKDGETYDITVASTTGGNFENLVTTDKATVTVTDTITPVDVTITATVTTPKIIDVTTATDGTTGVKITGFNSDGEPVDLSITTKTDHDGFGIEGKNLSNGDTKELGVGEKIVVEFTDGKDVNSLDVSFAWRNNHETARLTFIKDGQIVGYADVTGDGSSTTKAIVTYYDENNNLIKTVNAKGSSDKVDEAFTFELPDVNGGIVSFDKVEFSAPTNVDDYLINKIVYKEVLDPSVTNIITNGGDVTFNIQIDEDYPPQGSAKAIVSLNGIDYEVVLNATGRGTLTIDSAELGDLSKVNVIVKEIIGGNYEKVNLVEKDFDFTPIITIPTSSNDAISTDEDVAYILKVIDFGEVSGNTQEFKITELPTNGKLFLTITIGDTIFNPDGTQTIATQNTKVEITKDQIISLAQIGAEKVEFVPNKNSDNEGSFNFQVGDGKGNFSNDYTTNITVVAVADAPTASIDITKIGATTIVVDGNGNGGNSENNSNIKELKLLTTEKVLNDWGSNSQDINDNLTFTGTVDKTFQNFNNGSVTTGDGNDILRFASVNNGKVINTGSGDDRVIFNQDSNVVLNLGNGNNEADFVGGFKGTLASAEGNDKLIVNQSAEGSINLGAGNNNISIGGVLSGSVATGNGDDTLIVGQNVQNKSSIDLGDGNNTISIGGTFEGNIITGTGSDKIIINGNINGSNNSVSTGAGNDFVQIHGEINNQFAKVDLGEGDDGLRYEPTNWNAGNQNAIDGGKGFDTLYLKGNSTDYKVYTKDSSIVGATFWKNYNGENLYTVSWENFAKANEDSEGFAQKVFYIMQNNTEDANRALKVTNFESVSFDDKTFGEKDESILAYEYKVDISASLTDRDGSETLSVVIKNVPTGAILESTKYDVSKNPDGSWNVNFKTGTTGNDLLEIKDSLTLKVPRSYKEKINLEIESKATESRDNSNGENFATAKDDASVVTVTIEPFNAELDMDISEATIKVIETKDVNTLATSSAGIYEKDGKYYKTEVQSHTEKVLDTEALKNLQVTINGKTYTGITVGADGKYYVIDSTIAKEQKTIEVEREVTKTIELDDKSIDSFMIQVTKETKGIVLGKEVTNLGAGDLISNTKSKIYTLEQPTSNIEIKLVSGSAKLEFVDVNGKVIGSSTTQTGTDSKGYSVPKDAVGVKITSTSTSLKIDAIKYHVDPHEETVQVGGKILDVESMQKAGITWNSTVSEEKIQETTDADLKKNIAYDLVKLGSEVGDGNIKGFNPEAKANSQVFDFGKDKAYQLVTIKVDATISGSWNFNKNSTKDVFVVNANGVPQGAYNYTSSQDYSKAPSQTTINTDIATAKTNGYDLSYVNGSLNKTYEYKVYLDKDGKVQMNFIVASTDTDEVVTVNNISVSYAGLSGFVQTKTEIEKVTETIFVGVPTNIEYKGEVPTKDIIKYENVEVETTPIYTKVTQYEYVLDLNATITKGNGELSEVTLEKLPDGVKVQSYEANEDGSYTIKIGEDGKAKVTLVSDTLISPEAKQEITSSITATSEDKHQISNIEVNIDEKEESNQVTTFDGEGDIDLTSIIGQYKVNYIDLENGKANDIKLDFDEILADDKEIYIKGDDKDSISLNSELWKEAESTNVDGVKYNVYTGTNSAANSTIKLLIDDDIQVNHDI